MTTSNAHPYNTSSWLSIDWLCLLRLANFLQCSWKMLHWWKCNTDSSDCPYVPTVKRIQCLLNMPILKTLLLLYSWLMDLYWLCGHNEWTVLRLSVGAYWALFPVLSHMQSLAACVRPWLDWLEGGLGCNFPSKIDITDKLWNDKDYIIHVITRFFGTDGVCICFPRWINDVVFISTIQQYEYFLSV